MSCLLKWITKQKKPRQKRDERTHLERGYNVDTKRVPLIKWKKTKGAEGDDLRLMIGTTR